MSTPDVCRFRPGVERFEERDVPAFFTFQLPGATGYGDFTDPSGVDPTLAAQSIPVSGLTLDFQGANLTNANALTTPTAEYQFGVFVGVTTAFNLTPGTGPFQQLQLNGAAATGTANGTPTTVPITTPARRPFVTADFAVINLPVQQVSVTIRLDDETVFSTLINFVPADFANGGVGAANKVKNELKSFGFEVDANGGLVTVWGKGAAQITELRVGVTQWTHTTDPWTYLPLMDGKYGATASSRFVPPTP